MSPSQDSDKVVAPLDLNKEPISNPSGGNLPPLPITSGGKLPSLPISSGGKLLPPLPLLPGQFYSSPGQPANAGGNARPNTGPRAVSSAVIDSAKPPRGMDPSVHGRNISANLNAVAESLRSSGSLLPKVANGPQQMHPNSFGNSSAVGLAGREHASLDGASEINIHIATQDFLAAAADKFFRLSAEELVDAITPIVPKIAACRGAWASKFWAGSNILLMETPVSVRTDLAKWKNEDNQASLSPNEIDAIVITLAKIIKIKPGNFALAGPWIQYARSEFPGHELPLFTSLNEEQTFGFVLELCPHLARMRDAWILNGFTGREIMAMSPNYFITAIKSMHELVPNCCKLAPHQVSRVHEALILALKQYATNGHDEVVAPLLSAHEQFVRSFGLGGGALVRADTAQTPFKESPIHVSSTSSSSECQLTGESAPVASKRVQGDDTVLPPKRSLFGEPNTGNTSFLSQLGDKPRGTKINSSAQKSGAVFIETGDGKIVLQTAPPVVANYKLFERFDRKSWMEFIKQFRDETERLPVSARRPMVELVKHTVIEQIIDDFSDVAASWDDMTDDKLLAICFESFGPKTARDAKLLLEAVPFYFNNATMEQSLFVGKLVTFFSQKMVILADFEHAAKKWPKGEELTKYQLIEALINMFPTDVYIEGPDGKTQVLKSSNNKIIQSIIKENRATHTFKEL